MAPEAAAVALNPVEVRFTGGMLALNRLLMTLQNKRMPVADFTLGRDTTGMRATIILECPPETAQRYTALLSSLEDVQEAGPTESISVTLVKTSGDWRAAAKKAEVAAHQSGDLVVVSGTVETTESFLATLGEDVEDMVRLGPIASPGNGGI
jgi:hypothetical protein